MKSFKNIIGATAILTTVAMCGMTPENTGNKQEQIPPIELSFLLSQEAEPNSPYYGPNALARAKETARGINTKLAAIIDEKQRKNNYTIDSLDFNFKEIGKSMDDYDMSVVSECARLTQWLRQGYGAGTKKIYDRSTKASKGYTEKYYTDASIFYKNACSGSIYSYLSNKNLEQLEFSKDQ